MVESLLEFWLYRHEDYLKVTRYLKGLERWPTVEDVSEETGLSLRDSAIALSLARERRVYPGKWLKMLVREVLEYEPNDNKE